MIFYATPQEEANALRRSAARAGCRVDAVAIGKTSAGARALGRVSCPDGWAAARMLVALGAEDSRTPGARDLALRLRRSAPSDAEFARALHAFVKDRVRFVREAGEVFQGSAYTLAMGAGDCDDHARVMYAIARAGGLPAVMAFLHRGQGPTHAVAQMCPGASCEWAETTVDADYGEHPLAAADRLGLLKSRGDLAQKVRIMSEKDLPAVPGGYVKANPAERVTSDVRALQRLGFLGPWECADTIAADHPDFRGAVASFQRRAGGAAAGLVVDGMIGPRTRAAIARALPASDEWAMGYIAAAAPANARIAWAWPIMREAARSFGIESSDAVAILLAVSKLETNFGDPSSWGESHNWGGITFNASRGEPFVSWGYLEHGDTYEGKPVTYRFQAYPSDLEGAKDALRVKLSGGKRRAVGGAEVRSALESGDVDALAAAMFENGYYTGIVGTREQKIAAYANAIRGNLPTVRSSQAAESGVAKVLGGVATVAAIVGVIAAAVKLA